MQGEGLSSPEQFGLWEVEGVGLVLAFRGTASAEDVLVDVNIRPAPLQISRGMRGAARLCVGFCLFVPCIALSCIISRGTAMLPEEGVDNLWRCLEVDTASGDVRHPAVGVL